MGISQKGQGALENMEKAGDADLRELFIEDLKDIYWAEKHLVENLPQMAKESTSEKLKNTIESHLHETEGQVTRLERVFESIDIKPEAVKCDSMHGLVTEAKEVMGYTEKGSVARDVAITSCAQKVEQYEISTYGTLRTLASALGYTEAEQLLSATLKEEKNADTTLTEIRESFVNDEPKGVNKEKK